MGLFIYLTLENKHLFDGRWVNVCVNRKHFYPPLKKKPLLSVIILFYSWCLHCNRDNLSHNLKKIICCKLCKYWRTITERNLHVFIGNNPCILSTCAQKRCLHQVANKNQQLDVEHVQRPIYPKWVTWITYMQRTYIITTKLDCNNLRVGD